MSFRFRPHLNALEAREVPASLSALLSDGSVVSGQFSAPAGVDPAQASQELTISDLTVVKGGHKYNVQADATAIYASGVLVAVRAGAEGPDTLKFQDDGTVNDGQQSVAVALDGADTQSTFTLPDGTVGAISYQIPWDQVDPSQTSQSVTPTAFNLNIAGQSYTYAGATAGYFVTAPTLAFANGALTGAAFALDLTGTRAAYSSISVSNGVASAIDAATGAVLNSPVAAAGSGSVTIDFANIVLPPAPGPKAGPVAYSIVLYYNGNKTVRLDVEAQPGATAEDIRNLFVVECKRNGVASITAGTTHLNIAGTGTSLLHEVIPGPFNGNVHPRLTGRTRGSDGVLPDYTH